MPRMPQAEWVGEHGSRRMARYDIVCIHTIVGYAPAHAAHFSVKANGKILQSRDTIFQSGANFDGNPRIIAIENEDHGPAFGGVPRLPKWVPLTDEQVESNAQIMAWAYETHGVPLQLCPNSRPDSKGLAYHRQGIDGNFEGYRYPGRVAGGEVWTLHRGKVCPTDTRIDQVPDILERAIEIVHGDFTREEVDQLARIERLAVKLDGRGKNEVLRDRGARERQARQHQRILARLNELGVNDAEIKEMLGG